MTRSPHVLFLFAIVLFGVVALPTHSNAQGKNIMIISPHEDDETMFGAGVIYAAQQRGDNVIVVWVTNGDINGVSSGYDREAQSARAMANLNLTNQNLIFLGYGDSTLLTLYQNPSETAIITSPAGMNHTYGNVGLGGVDYHTYLTGNPGDYNRATLVSDFKALLTNFRPDEIYTTSYFDHHPDHACTYLFTVEALVTLARQGVLLPTRIHDTIIWGDTDGKPWPTGGAQPQTPFLEPPSLAALPYNWSEDESIPVPGVMQDSSLDTNLKYQTLLQYMPTPSDFFASFIEKDEFFWVHSFPTNLAPTATVEASSQDPVNNAMKAVDGVIEQDYGFAGDWATLGELSGAWIRLSWPNPVTVSHIVLYDRPGLVNQVLSGTLLFSDGSTIPVGTLPNKGSALHVPFPPRTVNWIQFTVTNAQGSSAGLSEIEVYGFTAGSQINHAPQIVSGPVPEQTRITELQSVNLNINAFDVDGDILQYDWTSDGGVITTGGPTALFQPSPVATDTVVTITTNVTDGRGGKATNSTFVTVSPSIVKVQSVSISPTAVQGGTPATGTITLGSVAQSGGAVVQLASSDSTLAAVPATVTVPAGTSTVTFSIVTNAVNTLNSVTISASYGGATQTASLTVTPPNVPIASLTLSPASVIAGDNSSSTVTLKNPASGSGTTVILASTSGFATVPATVTVPAGATSVNFTVKTTYTSSSLTATISASAGGTTASADLRITARIAPNLATTAAVSVSSENVGTGQLGIKATDTIIDGYPGDYSREWATNGQLAGAWIQLNWAGPVAVSQVVLYDRPNAVDNILAGTLTFSDGSSVPVGAVPDNVGLPVNFSSRTITWLKFQIDKAVGSNIGLAEIAVYGSSTPTAISSLSVSPSSLLGGSLSTGMVTLSGPAPAGGAVVTLTSDNTAAATVPPTITVAANSTTATFSVSTMPVASNASLTISASYNNATQTAAVTVTAAQLSGLGLNPGSVQGGSSSTGTVTLNGPAPAGGAVVTLTSDNSSAAAVPPTVTIAANANGANFPVTTSPVGSNTSLSISATYNNVTQTAGLTVTPPAFTLIAVSLNPSSVQGGTSSTGLVTLSNPAPSGGVVVALSSDNLAAANVPASVTVAFNSTTASFTVSTSPVSTNSSATISAVYNGTSRTAALIVTPAVLSTLSLTPASVVGGKTSTGTLTMSGPAPSGGAIVSLTSSDTFSATVPVSITVPANATSATFSITTTPVTATTSVAIAALYSGIVRTTSLTVTAATLNSISLSPTSVRGANSSTGTVTLNGPAPAAGAVVTLSSSNIAVASVPISVTIAPNATQTIFTVTTFPVAANASVTISGAYGVSNRSASLTVSAATLSSVSLRPTSVVGGTSSIGTVTLNGPAPAAGAVITLTSSNPSAATVPATVMITANATTASFNVTTIPVASNTSVTVSAAYGTTTRTAKLTVSAATLSSLSLSPTSVRGGNSSTGTITLNGPASAAGTLVTLSSSNIAIATVPSSVSVPSGSSSASFSITTTATRANRNVTISATRSSTRNAILTVTP